MDLKNNVYVRCPLLDKDYLYDPINGSFFRSI